MRLLVRLIALRRALSQERRYSRALEAQLEGEKARNMEREDTLLNMIPHSLNLFGPRVRDGRAAPLTPLRRQATQRTSPLDPWALLTEEEKTEWPMYLADADPDGTNIPRVKREFLQMIEMRRHEEGVEVM